MTSQNYYTDGRLKQQVVAVIGLYLMGYRDNREIAMKANVFKPAAGRGINRTPSPGMVREILHSADWRLRHYTEYGLPGQSQADIEPSRCLLCSNLVNVAPCVTCRVMDRIPSTKQLKHPTKNCGHWIERCMICGDSFNVEPDEVGVVNTCKQCHKISKWRKKRRMPMPTPLLGPSDPWVDTCFRCGRTMRILPSWTMDINVCSVCTPVSTLHIESECELEGCGLCSELTPALKG